MVILRRCCTWDSISPPLIPAKAGIQTLPLWLPAYAGTSGHRSRAIISPWPAVLQPGLADRRLERQSGVPREEDPGVLRDLGDEGVDHRPAHRLGIDGGEMRLRQNLAHHFCGLAGVDQVVDDQHALPAAAAEADDVVGDRLENAHLALLGVIIAPHAP